MLPTWLSGNNLPLQKTWVQSLGWEDSLEKEMATHSVFLPGESHGQKSLVGYSPWITSVGHHLVTKPLSSGWS